MNERLKKQMDRRLRALFGQIDLGARRDGVRRNWGVAGHVWGLEGVVALLG